MDAAVQAVARVAPRASKARLEDVALPFTTIGVGAYRQFDSFWSDGVLVVF